MADILAIIDQIIEEHKVILAEFESLEKVSNDATAMLALARGQDHFMPGRPSPREGLKKLEEVRQKVTEGLEAHFVREETALLNAFQEYGRSDLVSALKSLLTAHIELRSELGLLKTHMAELLNETLSRNLWEASGYEIKARITQIHKTIAEHAGEEQILLRKAQKDIRERTS
jgi:iron-sulfur cluster repair protein YtfE (RIC family)